MVKLKLAKTIQNTIFFQNVRLSHPFLSKPTAKMESPTDLIYTTKILIPKATDLSLLKKVTLDVIKARWGDKDIKIKTPLMDGDIQELRQSFSDIFKGHWYANVKSPDDRPPFLIDVNNQRFANLIDSAGVFYGGCYVDIAAQIYAYPAAKKDNGANRGIGLGLISVRKVRDAEAFGGGAGAYDREEFLAEFSDQDDNDDIPPPPHPVETQTVNPTKGEASSSNDIPW